jgi:hypothetical protein
MVNVGGVARSEQAVVEKRVADINKSSGKKMIRFIQFLRYFLEVQQTFCHSCEYHHYKAF